MGVRMIENIWQRSREHMVKEIGGETSMRNISRFGPRS